MRTPTLALALTFAHVVAVAQGKVSFQTDSLHLVYYADTGQGVSSAPTPAGTTLVADLYAGTSSTLLTLVSTTTFSAVPGKWNAASVTIPGAPGGSAVFLAVQVRDQGAAPPTAFTGAHYSDPFLYYYGASQIFQFTLGSSVTYPVMWGANGTWAAGTFDLGNGNKGAIAVGIPEPTSCALAVLSLGAITLLRRRK